jgi:inhibitor of cysteine peptidase
MAEQRWEGRNMNTVKLKKSDTGTTIEVQVGDSVEVRLPENPTTGYRWQAYDIDQSILAQKDVQYEPGGPAIGEGGTRIFRFDVVGPGQSQLQAKLLREWQGDSSIIDRFAAAVKAGTP